MRGEIFFILGLVGGLIGSVVRMKGVGRVLWLLTLGGCLAWVVVIEIAAVWGYGGTISQYYWNWSNEAKSWEFWLSMGLMTTGFGTLIVHLAWKRLTNRGYRKDSLK